MTSSRGFTRWRSLSVVVALLLAFASRSAFAQESAPGGPVPGPIPSKPALVFGAGAASDLAPAATLAAARDAAANELLAMAEHNASGKIPVQNGFTRNVDPVQVRLGFTELANRFPAHVAKGIADLSPDGERLVWTTVIEVAEANALRLHLSDVELPAGAVVLVYGDVDHALGPFDLALRDPLGGMWLPAVAGGRATIEVQVPVNVLIGGAAVSFTIDKVAELFFNTDAPQPASTSKAHSTAAPPPGGIGATVAPTCLIDSPCVTSTTLSVISDYRHAVAQLQYMKSDGLSYACSGGLVNDADPTSYIPYLLTANHCFSTQTEASSLTAYFDYTASACNGGDPCCIWNYPSVSGATLLDSRSISDFTFVRLNAMPSGYRWLLGWNGGTLTNGTTLHRLSHPAPDRVPLAQRYSQSTYQSSSAFACSGKPRPDFIYSAPTQGTTTPGSSGAPVIIDGNGGQIVGQLNGACSSLFWDYCTYSSFNTMDGAFATTFPYVSKWLDPTVTISSASTSPITIAAGSTFTITYNVTASTGTNVLLGASLRPSGTTNWTINDSPHDRFLTLANGSSTVTRQFTVPASASGTYDLLVAVWRDSNNDQIIDSGDTTLNSATLLGAETVTGANQSLSVTKSGTGTGTVTSSPAGINCGATCSASFAYNTAVSLFASASSGSTFTGWGGSCSGTGSCSVTMNAAKTVTASFATVTYTLTVTGSGTGQGTVTGNGINCTISAGSTSGTCSSTYSAGTSVSLTATATGSSTFTGWGGACAGSGTCSVTMNGNNSVSATFTAQATNYSLSVSGGGTGQGTVTGSGINCTISGGSVSGTCSQSYASGTSVSLTATPTGSSTFGGWGGACAGSGGCSVTMTANRSVSASFTAPAQAGTINVNATLNGAAWSGALSYQLTGAATLNGTAVPTTHASAPTGTYTISYQSGGPGGTPSVAAPTQTLSSGGAITFTFAFTSGATLPNLIPYQPPGWPDKIVLSKTAGTSINTSSFAPGDTVYVDWALANSGNASANSLFYIDLLVDGVPYAGWYVDPPFAAGSWGYVSDYPLTGLGVGTHTITILVDSTNAVAESNESDNQYTRTIHVGSQSRHDFDGDGKADLVWRKPGPGDTWLWLMNGNVSTSSQPLAALADPWTVAATGDFDGDGKADIIWRNTSAGDTWMWLMNGAVVLNHLPLEFVGPAWTIAASADFNGDGKADLIWRNSATGEAWMWLMNGAVVVNHVPLEFVGPAWNIAAAADFDGDGKADLVWRNPATGDAWMWLMNGGAVINHVPLGSIGTAWNIAAAADFNGDGKADLIWRKGTTGETWMWLMNGSSVSSYSPVGTISPPWMIAAASDFDGDGKADLIWRDPSTGTAWMWQMNGSQVMSYRVMSDPGPAWSIATKP
jgi:hypothetical protein